MTPLRKQFIQKLQLQGLSPRTVQTYVSTIAELSLFFKKSPELLSVQEIGEYILHLKERGISPTTSNNRLAGIKKFFRLCIPERNDVNEISSQKCPKYVPVVLSLDETISLISSTKNLKHRALLATIYSGGLRLNEAGQPLQVIQKLLGHSSIKTTTIYTHVTDRMMKDLRSPLEVLDLTGNQACKLGVSHV